MQHRLVVIDQLPLAKILGCAFPRLSTCRWALSPSAATSENIGPAIIGKPGRPNNYSCHICAQTSSRCRDA